MRWPSVGVAEALKVPATPASEGHKQANRQTTPSGRQALRQAAHKDPPRLCCPWSSQAPARRAALDCPP
ncbi:hypothetical protein GCM10015535_37960 [Streptomyces gelaticus]|uniref:Uncharacterized protein n=1 Tax=Streptomyces gelaticus TaxID=285446 RepID=A0ABQ2W0B8_9ACTN|nr:hypothetical protein GCM10015535_37960 [Streptomyces gelaticus]